MIAPAPNTIPIRQPVPPEDSLEILRIMAEALVSIDGSLKRLVDSAAAPPAVSLEAQAIALLLRDGPNVAQVARTLGVPRQRLYRMPKFVECLERMTGPRRVRKGFKTKGGGVEAVTD